MGLYSSRGESLKEPLIFKVNKETPVENFFQKENLEKSPWTDLKTTKTPAAFRTFSSWCDWLHTGDLLCRSFEAMKTFGDDVSVKAEERCDGDTGWFMFTSPGNQICPFEKKSGRQGVLLYSKGKEAAKFNDDSESSKCLSNTFSSCFFIPLDKNSPSEGLLPEKRKLSNRKFKQATFLSHGRKPEVNTSYARKVVFFKFSN